MLQCTYLSFLWMIYTDAISAVPPPDSSSLNSHQNFPALPSSASSYHVIRSSKSDWSDSSLSLIEQSIKVESQADSSYPGTTEQIHPTSSSGYLNLFIAKSWADITSLKNTEHIRPTSSSKYLHRTNADTYHAGIIRDGGKSLIEGTNARAFEEEILSSEQFENTRVQGSGSYQIPDDYTESTSPESATSAREYISVILGNTTAATGNTSAVLGNTTSALDNTTSVLEDSTSLLNNTTSVLENATSTPVTETPMCRCACHYAANLKLYRNATAVNITSDEVQKTLKKQVTNLQKQLSINKTNLSSEKRKKTSMNDDRASARGVGLIGVGMLVLLMGGLVLMDLTTIKRDFQRLRDNLGHCCKESNSAC